MVCAATPLDPRPGDGSDGVNIEEFVQGCYRLSGEATTLHTQARRCDAMDAMDPAIFCSG
jgi:hypothetical protein